MYIWDIPAAAQNCITYHIVQYRSLSPVQSTLQGLTLAYYADI